MMTAPVLVLCVGFETAPAEAFDLPGSTVRSIPPADGRRTAAEWKRWAERRASTHPQGLVGAEAPLAHLDASRVVLVTWGKAAAVVPRAMAQGSLAAVVCVDGCEGDPVAWGRLVESTQLPRGPIVAFWLVRYRTLKDRRRSLLAVETIERFSQRVPLTAAQPPPGRGLDPDLAHARDPHPGEPLQIGDHTWTETPWQQTLACGRLVVAFQTQGEEAPADAARYASSEGAGALLRGLVGPALARGEALPRWDPFASQPPPSAPFPPEAPTKPDRPDHPAKPSPVPSDEELRGIVDRVISPVFPPAPSPMARAGAMLDDATDLLKKGEKLGRRLVPALRLAGLLR